MLTEEETQFISYWEENRLKRRKGFRRMAVGLPMAVVLVVAIFINFFSGWYKRADMEIRAETRAPHPTLILVLIAAAILIVIFITVFSMRHRWDMYEQRYRELLVKKDKE